MDLNNTPQTPTPNTLPDGVVPVASDMPPQSVQVAQPAQPLVNDPVPVEPTPDVPPAAPAAASQPMAAFDQAAAQQEDPGIALAALPAPPKAIVGKGRRLSLMMDILLFVLVVLLAAAGYVYYRLVYKGFNTLW